MRSGGLIGIRIESELGKGTARIDNDDLYSLRAIRVSRDRCATGRVDEWEMNVDRSLMGWWCES